MASLSRGMVSWHARPPRSEDFRLSEQIDNYNLYISACNNISSFKWQIYVAKFSTCIYLTVSYIYVIFNPLITQLTSHTWWYNLYYISEHFCHAWRFIPLGLAILYQINLIFSVICAFQWLICEKTTGEYYNLMSKNRSKSFFTGKSKFIKTGLSKIGRQGNVEVNVHVTTSSKCSQIRFRKRR